MAVIMLINRNLEKVDGIIQKQVAFLNSENSGCYFEKNHYSFYFSPRSDSFGVSFVTEEQSSGSCWSEDLSEPKEYSVETSKVKSAIRVVISAVLPKTKRVVLNGIVHHIFNKMNIKKYKDVEYYGNYEKGVHYSISIAEIYDEINTYIHDNINQIDKVVNLNK